MIAKTLILWHGEKETDDTRAAALHFSVDQLDKYGDNYALKNKGGEVVAILKLSKGTHVREL